LPGVVAGFNGKTKLTIRKAYGLRTPEGIKIALFHTLGRLPEPEVPADSADEAEIGKNLFNQGPELPFSASPRRCLG
jgi:hypothetical protein